MSTETSPAFAVALAAYRAAAAAAFLTRPPAPKAAPALPYTRALFPALAAYLEAATERYRQHKQALASIPTSAAPTLKEASKPRALGSGPAACTPGAEVRRAAWQVWAGKRAHAARLPRGLSGHAARGGGPLPTACGSRGAPLPCGIPADVRKKFARRRVELRAALAAQPVAMVRLTAWRLGDGPLDSAPRLLAEHAARCIASVRAGESALRRQSGCDGMSVDAVDTFEAVRALYAGRPDAVYRRKSSRRFAAHRRRRREAVAAAARRAADAEHGMRARRGHDHLLTDRVAGDTSFAPFLFELDSRAYAFSSKISEAPKLRGKMIDKYSAPAAGEAVDSWRRAHEAAETNPLFHTRVMNRFG